MAHPSSSTQCAAHAWKVVELKEVADSHADAVLLPEMCSASDVCFRSCLIVIRAF